MRVASALALALVVGWSGYGAGSVAATAPVAAAASACPGSVSPLFVPLPTSVGGIVIDPTCNYVYLANTTQNRVEIYSLQTLTFEGAIQVGAQPRGLEVTGDGSLLYVANSGGNNISVVSLVQRIELRKITVPTVNNQFAPDSIAIASNGKALFSTFGSGLFGAVRELNLATDQVTLRDDIGLLGWSPIRLKASADRQTIVLAGGTAGGDQVTIYRAATDTAPLVKNLGRSITDVSVDLTGAAFLVTPGSLVIDDSPSMTGTIIGGSGYGGSEIDPTRGVGYRSVASRIDILNLATFLKIGELPLGDSVSSSSFSNRIGRMDLSVDGTLLAVITNGGFSLVRPLETAPQHLNLVRNGSFGNGATGWQTFATPDPAYVQSQVTGGVFQYNRLPPPPGTSNQAVVFQETGMALPAGAPIQARFDLGNSSTVRKRISVLLIESDWSDLHVCTFWVPPNAPLATYRMRSHTTKAWTNAAIYFYAATEGIDGGFNLIDDVSLQYDATLASDVTECVDPTAPDAPGGPDGPDLLVNGDFGTGLLSPWQLFGTITAQIAGGVFEFLREFNTIPAGVVLQPTGQPVAANEIVTATFDLGNSSAVRKRVTVILHDRDFSDLSACTFWLAPGQTLSTYAMSAFATQAWADATVSIYAATVDTEPWTRLDNVTFRRTPATSIFGTECVEPVAGSLDQDANAASLATTPRSGRSTWSRAAASTGNTASVRGRSGYSSRLAPSPVPAISGGVPPDNLIDLTGATGARLSVESWLQADFRGELQISVDGVRWLPVLEILPWQDWVAIEADLDAWTGQQIAVRFVLLSEAAEPQGLWWLRNLRVIIDRDPTASR